ncbi:hypothetical protein [Persicobacter psychrovividus]|uniref:Uncharacterized protein n=1 Tax=Persicobacter psychrovividus TaxID=387638 RepID=A0ABN6LFL9_9BACT|nr:hypothetical protein PEPS_27880 [Persicobacter psychrovividus]
MKNIFFLFLFGLIAHAAHANGEHEKKESMPQHWSRGIYHQTQGKAPYVRSQSIGELSFVTVATPFDSRRSPSFKMKYFFVDENQKRTEIHFGLFGLSKQSKQTIAQSLKQLDTNARINKRQLISMLQAHNEQ